MTPTQNSIIGLVMGLISLILSLFYTFPQLYKICKTRNTSGISLTSYIIFYITSIFWIIWACGFYAEQTHMYTYEACGQALIFQWSLIPAILLNSIDLLLMTFIISLKIYNLMLCRKYQTIELLLTNQLKKKQYWVLYLAIVLTVLFVVISGLCLSYLTKLTNDGNSYVWLIVINVLASLTWEVFNWPQFIKTIKTKDTTGISLFWGIFILVSCVVTFCYDLFLGFGGDSFNWSVFGGLVCNGIIPALGFLILKTKNLIEAKKLRLSEVEYIKSLSSRPKNN